MLHLGSIRGTTIDVDLSFLILIVFFIATSYNPAAGIQYALLWAPVIFISVLVHELAHAATIGLFGFGSSEILLTGMGGVTMNRRRAKAWQDMFISLAGPISSFLLAWICNQISMRAGIAQTDRMLQALLPILALANMFWGIFNLIPLAPLDGGHAVRNFLRIFLREGSAFAIAVWIGMVVGTGVVIWALLGRQFFLALFIAFFIYRNYQHWAHFRSHGTPGD
ncbi:MAG TPA: site-2 protease family protein [Thermoanaerobaculia bacterium]|nr:site-2 protease family protein [Thermoanaerobaculia bacterium]